MAFYSKIADFFWPATETSTTSTNTIGSTSPTVSTIPTITSGTVTSTGIITIPAITTTSTVSSITITSTGAGYTTYPLTYPGAGGGGGGGPGGAGIYGIGGGGGWTTTGVATIWAGGAGYSTGYVRLNSTTGMYEVFDGSTWIVIGSNPLEEYWETPQGESEIREKYELVKKAWEEYQFRLKLCRPPAGSPRDYLSNEEG